MTDQVRLVRDELSEVSLYVGSVEGNGGPPFTDEQMTEAISMFQSDHETKFGYLCPLRMERCRFVCKEYREDGWEVTAINYPRFPKTDVELCDFMRRLGVFLIHKFKQNRISIVARTRPSSMTAFTSKPGFIEMIEHLEAT